MDMRHSAEGRCQGQNRVVQPSVAHVTCMRPSNLLASDWPTVMRIKTRGDYIFRCLKLGSARTETSGYKDGWFKRKG